MYLNIKRNFYYLIVIFSKKWLLIGIHNGILWLERVESGKMFVGQSLHTLDDKQRVVLPSKARVQLSSTIYLSFDLDHCISIYSEKEYLEKAKHMNALDDFDKDSRTLKKIFFANSFEATVDKQGRLSLPKFLLEKARIAKEVVIVGAFDHLELYSVEKFAEVTKDQEDDYEALAQKVNTKRNGE